MPSIYDTMLGAAYLGILTSAILYGLTCIQTYIYLQNCRRDKRLVFYMVIYLWILDTVQMALASHVGYYYLISNFGNYIAILGPTWSLIVHVYLMVACDSTIRMRVLGILLFCAITSISLVAGGSMIVFSTEGFYLKTFERLAVEESLAAYVGISASVVGDVIVALSLCSIVTLMWTGNKCYDSLMKFLLIFFINTGLLTCLAAIACLITFIVFQHTFIWIAISFVIGKLYINTLLASLNARKYVYRDNLNGESLDYAGEMSSLRFKTVGSRGLATVDWDGFAGGSF